MVSHIALSQPGLSGAWVAYQQASAVPKPPAAILSSQHEGEGLTVKGM